MTKDRNHKCDCEWCVKTSPLINKICSLLTCDDDKNHFNKIINDLMHAETDAVYWKDKYYGTWPSDTPESIERHIKLLQKRIEKLKNGKQDT